VSFTSILFNTGKVTLSLTLYWPCVMDSVPIGSMAWEREKSPTSMQGGSSTYNFGGSGVHGSTMGTSHQCRKNGLIGKFLSVLCSNMQFVT